MIFLKRHLWKIIIIAIFLIVAAFGTDFLFSYFAAKTKSEELLNLAAESKVLNENLIKKRLEFLEQSQEKEVQEIIEFDKKIQILLKDYNEQIIEFDYPGIKKYQNIEEFKSIIQNNLENSEDFKDKINKIDYIPKQTTGYQEIIISYMDNNIKICKLLLDYYNSNNYANFDLNELKKIYDSNIEISVRINEERIRIFRNNNIEYLINGD
jgi:hypothetical protein